MHVIKTTMNQYLNRFAAFRDRGFLFQLSLIVLLAVIFSFAISRFWQLANENNAYSGVPSAGVTAGIRR